MAESERTYIMLKPDCVQRGLMGEVIHRIERKGYQITAMKMMTSSKSTMPTSRMKTGSRS